MTESRQSEAAPVLHRREIKSYVMRAGRMTPGQQRGIEQGMPKFGLQLTDGMQDFDRVFGRQAPRSLEIGFGMGQSLLEMAQAAPEQDFIGIEVYQAGVGALLNGLLASNINNVRVYNCDALDVLKKAVPDASLDRVMLFFPDPWHKSRHHKRRIVQPDFARLVCSKLKVGGIFHLATDWQPYAEHMLEVLNATPGFTNLSAEQTWVPRPAERPMTKFEQRGERLGHGVWDLKFSRTAH